jgi:SOS regulatory protein LexA
MKQAMKPLTKKEKIVLGGIKSYFSKEGMMPTIRELQEELKKMGLKLKSARSILLYLQSLEEKGQISRSGDPRGIRIKAKTDDSLADVPILGTANAGSPTFFAEENLEGYLKISKSIIKNRDVFAIQVSGTSMNLCEVEGKKIGDGDYVIIDPEDKDFRDNDKVLVVIDGLATIKLYKRTEKGRIGLFPVSTDRKHRPIYLTPQDEFIINGKIIDVFQNIGSDRTPNV